MSTIRHARIEPKPISGFREFLPEEQMELERMKRVITKHFELFGFAPIEVAAVERTEVLLSKAGENTKQIYGIHLLARADQEHGQAEKELALHFDLTVPLARYVAQNYGKLTFPFRRYQIQKVWRGERAQEGRFREFYQCDIDVIGDGHLGLLHDAEIPAVIYRIFSELAIGKFLIRISNRKVCSGLLADLGLPLSYKHPDDGREVNTLNIIDKMDKVGEEKTAQTFVDHLKMAPEAAKKLIAFLTHRAAPADMIAWLPGQCAHPVFREGVDDLRTVVSTLEALGIPQDAFIIDLGITRGLDYYTGTIYETILVDQPDFGSVCSGGRYDNLAETFTDKKLPGVGISIGLTRLFAALLKQGLIKPTVQCASKAVIFQVEPALQADYFTLASQLRAEGIAVEVFGESAKLEKQIKYALKKQIPYGIFYDATRKERGVASLKNFRDQQETEMPLSDLARNIV